MTGGLMMTETRGGSLQIILGDMISPELITPGKVSGGKVRILAEKRRGKNKNP